jgi:hypothetical protein
MAVFINNHTTKENGNGFYLLDLIDKLNLKSVKIISLSYKVSNKKHKVFTFKHKKKSKNFLGKILEIFYMNYLILKNIKELKNETIIFTSDPPMLGIILILIAKISKFNLIFWCQDIFPDTLIVSNILKRNNIFFLSLRFMNKFIYNNVGKIVTISNSMKKTLIKDYKVNSNKIILIENWNLAYFKKKTLIKNDKINIFYNGNISLVHDEEFALDFINQIKNEDLHFKIFTNSQKIKKKIDKKLLNKGFLNKNSFHECLLKSDFQMIFSKPSALKYVYPSKIYNILHYKKPIIYFNKSKNDEISKFLNKYQIGININNENMKKFIHLFSDTKKIKTLIKLYKNNYKKLKFFEQKKNISIAKWKDVLKCVE